MVLRNVRHVLGVGIFDSIALDAFFCSDAPTVVNAERVFLNSNKLVIEKCAHKTDFVLDLCRHWAVRDGYVVESEKVGRGG